ASNPSRTESISWLAKVMYSINRPVNTTRLGRMDVWDKPMVSFAEVGAWLALTAIYRGSW
ncbi:MAG TPA: hypothetical protein VHP11_04095, partial [Tepidisphaeraceae bacterium]|nr:hypothetical protein [Tepidisphaeraceae bacterium]